MSENIEVIANWLKTNWSGKWVSTTPTFKRAPLTVEDRGSLRAGINYIIYEPLEFLQLPASLNKEWWNYILTMKFTLIGQSRTIVQDMFSEVSYVRNKFFYAAPWYPKWDSSQSETLCHLDCNEGTGTDVLDSTANNYDFAFTAADADPAWVTTGALYQANYISFDADDSMTNGTLLDTMPAALTLEMVVKLAAAENASVLYKSNVADPPSYLGISNDAALYISAAKDKAGTLVTLSKGTAPSSWINIMVTMGARGMELFLNGILISSSTSTTVPSNGTAGAFTFGAVGALVGGLSLCRFRASSVQRVPVDSLSVPQFKSIERFDSGAETFTTDIYLQGRLASVYLGRPSYG